MDLNDLRLFLTVAELQSVSRAAERLHTVQSNVSARLRALEMRLGTQLFVRHARGVTLTNAGEMFVPYAEQITRLLREGIQLVTNVDDPSGSLQIGAMETTAGWRLPSVLSAFAEACPNVDIKLQTGPSGELLQLVTEHRLDGAFVADVASSSELVAVPVWREELVLVTSRRAPALDVIRPAAEPSTVRLLVFRSGCSYRERLVKAVDRRGRDGHIVEFGSLDGILGCVAAGMGVTLLPEHVVRSSRQLDEFVVTRLPPEEAIAETSFVRRKDVPLAPAMRRFLEAISNETVDTSPPFSVAV